MRLRINGKRLFVNNRPFCHVGPGNERDELPQGHYNAEVSTATAHGHIPLVRAAGLGWIGGFDEADCVVGRLIGPTGVVPCSDISDTLIKLCEAASDLGERITLEVE